MNDFPRAASAIAVLMVVASCAATPPMAQTVPADEVFADLSTLCGKAYVGRVVVDRPAAVNDPFSGKRLLMHVRECNADAIRIPFHVGGDRSRTWVITRIASVRPTPGSTATGLRLKHDHRHQDGSEDAVTQYGGDTVDAGTSQRQEFPADTYSKAMFAREKLAASIDNTWAIELIPARTFTYELSRPGGRLFRVEFDLAKPVAVPP